MSRRTTSESAPLQTVARGFQVLRAFRSDRAPVGNTELVRRTGLSKATVSRLTSTLVQMGFLRQVPGGREFELAAGALGMGHSFLAASPLHARLTPFMQTLADRLGVSVALGMRDGLDMLYVAYRVSPHVATLRLGLGSVLPMATTAIGRAYLFGLTPAERLPLLGALRRGLGSAWAAIEPGLHESFRELEASGTCALLGAFQRGAYAVACPVRVGLQRQPMALSCGKAVIGPNLATERKRIAPVLREAAAHLELLVADLDGEP